MAHLPDLSRLMHARKDTLILALWAQVQELLVANADLTRRVGGERGYMEAGFDFRFPCKPAPGANHDNGIQSGPWMAILQPLDIIAYDILPMALFSVSRSSSSGIVVISLDLSSSLRRPKYATSTHPSAPPGTASKANNSISSSG